jgi:hypothetical protein
MIPSLDSYGRWEAIVFFGGINLGYYSRMYSEFWIRERFDKFVCLNAM